MSINQAMNISLNSMKNNQNALTVVSHNIANLNTKGYAKERVEFSESRYSVNTSSAMNRIRAMNGANITSLTSYVDGAKFKAVINSNTDANYYNGLADALTDLENVADDLGDSGLNSLLNDFFTSAANLERFPSDLSIRQQYVMALDSVCDKFNYITDRYDTIQDEQYQESLEATTNLNELFKDLATVNLAHVKNNKGSSTQNDINQILSEISNYGDFTYSQNESGSYNLSFAGVEVVRGTEVLYEIQSEFDESAQNPLNISLVSLENGSKINVNDNISSGSLKGNIDFVNGTSADVGFLTVKDMKASIQSAQTAFANALNEIQQYEDTTNGVYAAYITSKEGNLILAPDDLDNPTRPETPPELVIIGADGKIQVNQQVMQNPFYVAAARIDLNNYAPGEDWTQSIGNADNANLIMALQDKKICSYGGGTNNCTLSQFLINNAAKNGMDLASMENKAELYQGIADQNANTYNDSIGVSLDEELADMIRYQRAYEASAAIFSVINNMVQTVINMV